MSIVREIVRETPRQNTMKHVIRISCHESMARGLAELAVAEQQSFSAICRLALQEFMAKRKREEGAQIETEA